MSDATHSSPTAENRTARVLIIDDLPENRGLLSHILQREGHQVIEAASGEEGLAILEKETPDAILLDVMMPGLDGFEVCRRIKESPRTEHIPVILVTALRQGDYRLKGVSHGADDYISKPYDPRYLALRVRNAVRMKLHRDEAERQNAKLRESEKMRDRLVNMLIHDLRSPLKTMLESITQLQNEEEPLPESVHQTVDSLSENARGLIEMINDILEVNPSETSAMSVQWADCNLGELIEEATARRESPSNEATLTVERSESLPPSLRCDPSIVRRVIGNLIDHALNVTPEEGEVKVSVDFDSQRKQLRFQICDEGSGITSKDRQQIFDRFGRNRANATSPRPLAPGIGLAYCKMGIEAMGGKLGADSTPGKGTTFWFELPVETNPELALAY